MEHEVVVLQKDNRANVSHELPVVRVGAYCRVSTEVEEQQTSIDLQIKAFQEQILIHPGWTLVDIYADDGVSGTMASKRTEFQRMLQDSREGKIDYIITKSISRFARNTVECLSYVRELQACGTQVLFEKEKIDTGTPFSEMLLTILAAFAQEESRSISENIKWGLRKRYESGEARVRRVFGYDVVGDKYVVIPEEAKTIRRIFDLYETGHYSYTDVGRILEEEGRLTSTGNKHWALSRIHGVLMNEKYVGDVLWQKRYSESHITHRIVINRDLEVPQYYIKDHHEPIISRKQFERCKKIKTLTKSKGRPSQYPYADMLVCPICGHRLRQHAIKGHQTTKGWHCDRDADSCGRYILRPRILDKAILEAFNDLNVADIKAAGGNDLAEFKTKHWKLEQVDFYWLDEYVEKIIFGHGHTMTVIWKCGLKTTVKMHVTCDTYDPVKLAEIVRQDGN